MPSIPEQLKELIEMLESGYITREEFEVQKRRVLGESSGDVGSAGSGPSPTTSDAQMAREVGAYRLLATIGEGGMGAVHRGRHRSQTMAERQGGDVALKVMHAQYANNPAYRDRFEREAALGMKLEHPSIVRVHDLVVDGGNLALVMEFVQGQPLSASVGEEVGPIPWERAWALLQPLFDAVGYAHDQGVVHRDLKPDNVLVTPDGRPHVIDFGIAKDRDASGTRTGTGMGTVEYMAPEQYTDAKAVDLRADVYSLGMILYEMLAGRLPWESTAPQFEILEQKARRQLMSPSAFCADIAPEIVAALSLALAADPAQRYASTAAFAAALEEAGQKARRRASPPAPAAPPPAAADAASPGVQPLGASPPVMGPGPSRYPQGYNQPPVGARRPGPSDGGGSGIAWILMAVVVLILCGGGLTAGAALFYAWSVEPVDPWDDGLWEELETAGGSSQAGRVVNTCNDIKVLSNCVTYEPRAFDTFDTDFYQALCELSDGTWGTNSCPLDDRVGSCDDGWGQVTFYYSAGGIPYDTTRARTACWELSGTFTP